MNSIFKKMQFKSHPNIWVVNAPDEFEEALREMNELTQIHQEAKKEVKYEFILIFVKSCQEINDWAEIVVNQLTEDGLLWFAYPKKSSKKYKSDIGRDDSWSILGKFDFEGVRMIAIDDDWSAFRFRNIQYIKNFVRNEKIAVSEKGKARSKDKA
jgi:hypothetical protein